MKFTEKVYAVVRKIPKGKVSTYKEIARLLHTKAYRAIGTALSKNTCSSVPCHRVVNSNGNVGGYFGKTTGKNIKTKIKMLQKEGIKIKNNKILVFRI